MKYIKIILLLLVSNSLFGQSVLLQGGTKGSITRTNRGDSLTIGNNKVRDDDNPNNTGFDLQNYNRYLGPALYRVINNSGDANIVLLGDSKIEQDIIPDAFKRLLNDKWEFDGPGYWQPNDIIRQSRTVATPNSLSANGWTLKSIGTGGRGLPIYSLLSTGASVPFYWLPQNSKNTPDIWTTLEVWYYGQVGGANLAIEIDSVSVGTINTSLTTGFQKVTYTVTEKQHSVKVTPSAAGAEILGFKTYRTSVNAVSTHRIGHAGAKASDYIATDSALWNPQFRALNPDITFVYLGANERAAGTSAATFKTSMHNWIVRLRQAKPTMDICLLGQSDLIGTFGSPTATTAQYNDQLRQLAIEDSCSYFDIQQIFGMYAQANAKGLFAGDGIHESLIGGNVIANSLINSIPVFNKSNLKDQFVNAFGVTNPVNSSGQTSNRLIVSDASGNVTTFPALATSANNSIVITGNLSAGNIITATAGLTGGASPPYSGGALNIGGSKASIGYFGWSTGSNTFTAGYTGGIRMDGAHSTIRLQNTNQGAVIDQFTIENFAGVIKQMPNNNSTILNITEGVGVFNSNLNNSVIRYTGAVNQSGAVTGSSFTGFWFDPVATSLNGINLIGFRNTIGNNYLNVTSGNTGIGLAVTVTPSEKLEVAGNVKFSGALMPNNTAGTSGQVLTSAGAGTVPTWTTNTSEGTTIGAFQSSGNSNGLTLSGTDIRLHAATISTPGGVNVGLQTFGVGADTKVFNGTGSGQITVDGNTDNTVAGINFTQQGTDLMGIVHMNSSDADNARLRLALEQDGGLVDQMTIGTLNDSKGMYSRNGLYEDVTTVTTSPYTVLYGDRNIYLDEDVTTVNLQAIGTSTAETKIGRVIYFFNDNATNVTITPNGSETINDSASLTLLPNTGVTLLAVTGTKWVTRD